MNDRTNLFNIKCLILYWLIDSFQMATNLRQSSCPQALSRQSLWRDSCSRRRRWQEKQGKPLSGGQWRWLCSSGRKVGSALLGDNSDWQVVWNILALVGRKWEGGRKTIHLTLVGSRMCFLKRDWGRCASVHWFYSKFLAWPLCSSLLWQSRGVMLREILNKINLWKLFIVYFCPSWNWRIWRNMKLLKEKPIC